MKAFSILIICGLTIVSTSARGQSAEEIRKLEASGDTQGARAALAKAAAANPDSVPVLTRYAEFLDRYSDPACRAAYSKLLAALRTSGDNARTAAVARRLVALDLEANDREAAARDLEVYRSASGKDATLGEQTSANRDAERGAQVISIPGPMRSFARMAAISGDAAGEDVLPALARNVVTNGYQASHSNDALEQTEYLKLLHRYLSQARELAKLAGETKAIRIESCDSANVAELLRILGFRMRGGCGSEVVLETVNAARAFLTTDSGFPVHELEQAMRTNRPFTYNYQPSQVPVAFGADYWIAGAKDKESPDFIETFISDPSLCRA